MATRDDVRAAYARVATGQGSCCGPGECGPGATALEVGYAQDDLVGTEGANLGLGCGNPTALAELAEGEVVVDLGSGAGFDAILAARRVGPRGRVIGVDMTPEMVAKARANVARLGLTNVELREGILEDLPLRDGLADVAISNCVINLSPDKPRALAEAYRILKPGGRLRVSDIATTRPISEAARAHVGAWTACLSGALPIAEYRALLTRAGFEEVTIEAAPQGLGFEALVDGTDVDLPAELRAEADAFVSVRVLARKPL